MTIPFRIHHRVAPVMLAAATALGVQAVQAATWVYVANADSQDVSVLELDRAAGTLKTVDTTALGGAAMPMAVSPDKRVLYVALRSQPFRVVSLAIDPASGKLRKLGEAPLADSMANIDTDATGRWLFAASYPGHKITVNSIGKDGVVGAVQQSSPPRPTRTPSTRTQPTAMSLLPAWVATTSRPGSLMQRPASSPPTSPR